MYRILICGSRTLIDKYNYIMKTLDNMLLKRRMLIEYIISGCAKGIDTFAIEYAMNNGIKCLEFPADWNKYGKSAGFIRNKQMLDEGNVTHVIAFQDVRKNSNGSNGTNNTIKIAQERGIPTKIIYVK